MSETETEDPINDKPMPLLDHLMELRRRLMWSIVAFFVAFVVCYYFSAQIYSFLAQPLAEVLRASRAGRSAAADLHPAVRGVLHPDQAGVVRRRCSSPSR